MPKKIRRFYTADFLFLPSISALFRHFEPSGEKTRHDHRFSRQAKKSHRRRHFERREKSHRDRLFRAKRKIYRQILRFAQDDGSSVWRFHRHFERSEKSRRRRHFERSEKSIEDPSLRSG